MKAIGLGNMPFENTPANNVVHNGIKLDGLLQALADMVKRSSSSSSEASDVISDVASEGSSKRKRVAEDEEWYQGKEGEEGGEGGEGREGGV
jgi:hypothetical protein